jgi:hypothetical protein
MDAAATTAALATYSTPGFAEAFNIGALDGITVTAVDGAATPLRALLSGSRTLFILGRNLL